MLTYVKERYAYLLLRKASSLSDMCRDFIFYTGWFEISRFQLPKSYFYPTTPGRYSKSTRKGINQKQASENFSNLCDFAWVGLRLSISKWINKYIQTWSIHHKLYLGPLPLSAMDRNNPSRWMMTELTLVFCVWRTVHHNFSRKLFGFDMPLSKLMKRREKNFTHYWFSWKHLCISSLLCARNGSMSEIEP